MKYQYYLDNVLLADEPQGWQELTTSIKRQTDIKGIFVTQDVKLIFAGDGYTILKNKFDTSFCSSTDIKIYEFRQDAYALIFDGIIFASACVISDNICSLEATLEDNSFFAKIYNNRSIDVQCQVGLSKNGVTYTGATSDVFNTFDPCTGITYIADPRVGVTPYEAFRSIIAFVTDDTVDFESSILEVGGEWNSNDKRILITSGLKLGSTDPAVFGVGEVLLPKFSFLKLFQEIDKNLNIGIMIDTTGVRPKVVIEYNSFFYNNESLMRFDFVNGMKTSIDQEKLYASVRFGSSTILDGDACPNPAFPERQQFLSFIEEQYYVLGICNIDTELNLVREWVVSSNVIQSIVFPLTSTSYDNDLFLVVVHDIGFGNIAKQGNPFGFLTATPRYYNEDLLNSNVATRYLGGVPNNIAGQLSNITDECYVGRVGLVYPSGSALICPSGTTRIHTPNEYNDKTTAPFFDTNNRFALDPVNTYTCGPASGGIYILEVIQTFNVSLYTADIPFNVTHDDQHKLKIICQLDRFDAASVYITSYICYETAYIYGYQPDNVAPLIGSHTFAFYSQPCVLDPGDYIQVKFTLLLENVGVAVTGYMYVNYLNGTFKTIFTSKGGGDLQAYDPLDYPVYNHEFTYHVTPDQFDTIKNNANKSIEINIDGENNFNCFIDQAKYSHKTGLCNFTLLRPVQQ